MVFNEVTRELSSESGYIHAKDDSLYTDYSIYLGKYDSPDNYEQGNKDDFEEWKNRHDQIEEELI